MANAWKLSPLALLIASPLALAGAQQESAGFLEDSSLSITSRAVYFNSDQRNGAGNNPTLTGFKHGHAEESGLGVLAQYESGFTQGTVGFGVDAHLLSTLLIDTGKGRYASDMFAADSNGNPETSQSELGGAVKLRVSDTVIKHGNLQIDTPVFSTDDTLVPEIATGTLLTSDDIEGVSITAGRFTGLSSMIQTTRDDSALTTASIFGISAEPLENSTAALFVSKVDDYFRKLYINLGYSLELSNEQSIALDFNGYRTKDEGRAINGQLDNKIWSLTASYSVEAHTLSLGYQRSSGKTGFDYGIDGGGAIYLGNSVVYSDFMGADERSWLVRYEVDMESYGVPGLAIATTYTKGDDIDVGTGVSANEREFDIEVGYTVQEGAARDLSIALESAVYRASSSYDDDVNEVRLTLEYPLDVL